MITVGQLLKSRRNSKEISLEEISQELKISIYTLEQIENDQVTNNADIMVYEADKGDWIQPIWTTL